MMLVRSILGLDLGQAKDFSALVLLREAAKDSANRTIWDVPLLKRWQLGTPYPLIVKEVGDLCWRLSPKIPLADLDTGKPVLAVDATGVGRAVVDMFREARLSVKQLLSITITGGHYSHEAPPDGKTVARDCWNVPKKELVGCVQSALQGRRLRIAKGLPEAAVLTKELQNFKVKITTSANESFEAWREGDHDDMVLSLAIALWVGERPKRVAQAVFISPVQLAATPQQDVGEWQEWSPASSAICKGNQRPFGNGSDSWQ